MTNSLMQRGDLPSVLPTDEAAAAINRKPQTLRKWACLENGPIRPVRINGRLAWKVSDLQALLNGGANG
ncbi:DNA-binding protein [Caballeronia sp. LZ019]|nr:DNA-binding protein [Caballeronia sp. LZ019]MDR5809523.1 DNA-binding protein [Caballeronia sp. LZ019]